MLLPTITYGFAIIYSFGKQGLLTQLFGRQLFDIYGFNGLLLGYVVYTLPIAFTLIQQCHGVYRQAVYDRVQADGGFPAADIPDDHTDSRCWELWRRPLSRPFSCALRISAYRLPWAGSSK